MTSCPACRAPTDPDDLLCAACGTRLGTTEAEQPSDVSAQAPPPSGFADGPDHLAVDLRLGIFDPLVVDGVLALLHRRGVPYVRVERDDDVEVRVDSTWRDDLRTELMLTWHELLRAIDTDDAPALQTGTGIMPGWFDAPRGGYIDRAGRMVVSDADDEEEARVIGPALLAAGAILGIFGWYAMDSGALLSTGFALVVLGLFIPR